MAKTRSCISFCAAFSISLILVVAFLIVVLRRDRAAAEAVAKTEENSQEFEVRPKEHISSTVNSSSRIEPNSAHKHHRRHREFCRKCCHTPPCWYNNHKECSKCVKKEQLELHVTRLLKRSHKKAMQNHHRRTEAIKTSQGQNI